MSLWSRYEFDRKVFRTPPPARREVRLTAGGGNLAALLHTLQSEHPERFSKLKDILREVVPEIEDVYTPLTEQGQAVVKTRERGLRIAIPLQALSDGTLHVMGMLAALYGPEAPDVMFFEEPENEIHPRAIQVLAEEFEAASYHRQIVIATHSPYLVDCFRPEHLFIVEKVSGGTVVKKASRHRGIKDALSALRARGAVVFGRARRGPTVGLIVEGKSDREALPLLVRRATGDERLRIVPRVARRGDMFNARKVATLACEMKRTNQGLEKILVCVDCEDAPSTAVNKQGTTVRREIQALAPPISPQYVVVVHALESWTGANPEALRPKERLRSLFRRHCREFDVMRDNRALASRASIEAIKSRNRSFAGFHQVVVDP